MKLRWQILIALGLLLALILGFWALGPPRPFFGNLSFLGRWRGGDSLGLADDRIIYYDLYDNVLMVVQVERDGLGGMVQWLVDDQPVGPILRVRRQRDDVVRTIEWRRDCIITLDGEGNPTYRSLSPQVLHEAVSTPYGWSIR